MKSNIYILNSPDFPGLKDFERFPVWCEWNDAEEVPYLKELCDSESEYEKKLIGPYEQGRETYYPIIETTMPERLYLSILVDVTINEIINMNGYVTTVADEIVALCVWLGPNGNSEINLLSNTRLLAEEDNPTALKKLSKHLALKSKLKISFDSEIYLSNGAKVSGIFEV